MSWNVSAQDLQGLRRCFLFAGLEDEQFQEVLNHASTVDLPQGHILFNQGDPANAFYWVAEGVIRLYRASPQGDEKVIELAGTNRLFAEAVLFMGGLYPVNAAAQVHARLVAFDGRTFKEWLARDARRCFPLLAGMSSRLHKLVNEIDRLTLMKGSDRLLQYLLDHSDPDETGRQKVEWEAPKQVIASRIGVKPETLSRLLHKLGDQGCIELDGNALYIKDTARLVQGNLD
ncbi:MAG TPA: Crp/Fnr family transcriptional regulator [Thiobacillaceae bacterium]|nr:Crp/Fnr family transcriptional regulator [Thiobacillaceae bacterium]HNU65318.1 Crp/Fnr family transcriptional regulator [Thiobacillaceae bacterium]